MEKQVGVQTKKGASKTKTKIVWTLGPASRSVEVIEQLLEAGMNVARFNFSDGSHEYHQETLDNLRTAMENTGILCAVMLDTKGPEIQTGNLKEGKPIDLVEGQEITISANTTIIGDSKLITMSYNKLAEDLKPGDVILLSDGMISLTVLYCDKYLRLVRCRCQNTAVLGERENVYLPGIVVDLPTLTEKDKEDILQWGVPNKIDIIALSFVRRGSDLDELSELLGEHRKSIMLMSKIENEEGLANLDEIMEKTDAVMLARGTLGLEMPTWKLGRTQKGMINRANVLGKPIVTAIQFPHLTRAETIHFDDAVLDDITKAVLQGTDCVMLSGKTAVGSHPENSVLTMSRICKEAEDLIDSVQKKFKKAPPLPLTSIETSTIPSEETIAAEAVSEARRLKAKAIIVLTKSGYLAELVAKYRPSVPILSVVEPGAHMASRGLVYRWIIPLVGALESADELINFAVEVARRKGICRIRDSVVVLRTKKGRPVVLSVMVD